MKTFLLYPLFVLLLLANLAVAAPGVSGKYVAVQGGSGRIQVTIASPPPAAFIIQQSLPQGVQLVSASPAPKGHDPKASQVKWLFKQPQPGVLTINMQFSKPITAPMLRGEIRFRDPKSGKMFTKMIK